MYNLESNNEAGEAFLGGDKKDATNSFDSMQRKQSKWGRFFTSKYTLGIVLTLALVAVVSIILFEFVIPPHDSDDDDTSGICYLFPSCTTEQPPNSEGFTNSTGYSPDTSSNSCCNACFPGTNATVCFDPDGSCAGSTGDGDYDFILLDEMWIPQFCHALSNNYDPTLSHTAGMKCQSVYNELSIHGLWPNYVDGYPQCCNASGNLQPLRPEEVEDWTIYPMLEEHWYDPAPSADCSTCYLLNHEWEKHGNCYSPGDPVAYFASGLQLKDSLNEVDSVINSYAGMIVNTSFIEGLYPKKPNIVCDPNDPQSEDYLKQNIGILLETQSCWSRDLDPIDCPAVFEGAFTYGCPPTIYIRNAIEY